MSDAREANDERGAAPGAARSAPVSESGAGTDGSAPLRIVSGSPTPEEVAVVTALVLASSGGDEAPAPATPRGRWADPFDQHRRPWQAGPGGWRAAVR